MVSVRQFRDADASELADIMLEMVAFYGNPLMVEGPVGEDIIRQSKNIDIVVALSEDHIVGFATYGILYPVSGLRSFAYLQQIYVGSQFRRLGVAQSLMSFIAKSCQDRGCNWMEWSTGCDNLPAQRFYEGLGATGSKKIAYEITGEALRQLALLSE